MDVDKHTPSLTHLREFTRARAAGRPTHVASDRRQVLAPANDRIFAFAYERFLSGVITFVRAGNRGGALEQAVFEASDRMRPSYAAAAKGMVSALETLRPLDVQRRQGNVVVVDSDGYELVSLRIHLLFESSDRRVGASMYFSEKGLSEPELVVMDTAIALAARMIDPLMLPALIMVRRGEVRLIDAKAATSEERVSFLRSESMAYRAAWAVAE